MFAWRKTGQSLTFSNGEKDEHFLWRERSHTLTDLVINVVDKSPKYCVVGRNNTFAQFKAENIQGTVGRGAGAFNTKNAPN